MLNYGRVLGPYTRKDKRKHVIVWDKLENRWRTISYPKYLLEKKLDRRLNSNETADHKDEDKTNDEINNLQVLTREKNAQKSAPLTEMMEFICRCGNKFKRPAYRYRANQVVKKNSGPYCSKSCAGLYSYY